MQFHAGLKAIGGLAVSANAHIAGGDTFYRAIVTVQNFRCGKAGVDLNPELFSLLSQPADYIAQADDVVAVVLQRVGHHEAGHLTGSGRR